MFAPEEVLAHGRKALVERDAVARLVRQNTACVARLQVEYDNAAVVGNPVDVEVEYLWEPIADTVQVFLDVVVTLCIVPQGLPLLDPVAVDDCCGRSPHTLSDGLVPGNRDLAVQEESGGAGQGSEQDFGNDNHDDNLAQQGTLDEVAAGLSGMFTEVRVEQEYVAEKALEFDGNVAVDE